IRPLRPACGTVSNAQLLTLPAIIRIIAPGEVTTQLLHSPPASSSATDVPGSSESRLATAQPPEPAPTTTESNLSVMRILPDVWLLLGPVVIARSDLSAVAQRAKAEAAKRPRGRHSGMAEGPDVGCAIARSPRFSCPQAWAFAELLARLLSRGVWRAK